MRWLAPLCSALLLYGGFPARATLAQPAESPVAPATYHQPLGKQPTGHEAPGDQASAATTQADARILKIVLNQGDNARALAQLVQLTRDLPDARTAALYDALASDYLQRGQFDQAAGVLQQLVHQFPNLSSTGLTRLLQLYTSSEVATTQRLAHGKKNDPAQFGKLAQYGLYVVDQALQQNTALERDPALTFQRAVALRISGRAQAATGRLTRLKHSTDAGPWRTRAQVEPWLATNRQDEPPLPVATCWRAAVPPQLDGVLEDACWQATETPGATHNEDAGELSGDSPTGSLQLAYDQEFLYLAASYPKLPDVDYPTEARPRVYDADLSTHDRVVLWLDADRDYTTCYQLTVDHRGWTGDRCWLNTSWNPQWFLAASAAPTCWTIEAAIPWQQLTPTPPTAGSAWAFSTRRLLPTSTAPDPATGPDDFQLLLFQ